MKKENKSLYKIEDVGTSKENSSIYEEKSSSKSSSMSEYNAKTHTSSEGEDVQQSSTSQESSGSWYTMNTTDAKIEEESERSLKDLEKNCEYLITRVDPNNKKTDATEFFAYLENAQNDIKNILSCKSHEELLNYINNHMNKDLRKKVLKEVQLNILEPLNPSNQEQINEYIVDYYNKQLYKAFCTLKYYELENKIEQMRELKKQSGISAEIIENKDNEYQEIKHALSLIIGNKNPKTSIIEITTEKILEKINNYYEYLDKRIEKYKNAALKNVKKTSGIQKQGQQNTDRPKK